MKCPFFLSKKFLNILLGILVLGFCLSCENDLLQTENATDPEALVLKSAKTNNFMVISKAETLTSDLEQSLKKFGTIVKTIPQIGIVVMETSDPNFENKVAKLSNVRSVVPELDCSS